MYNIAFEGISALKKRPPLIFIESLKLPGLFCLHLGDFVSIVLVTLLGFHIVQLLSRESVHIPKITVEQKTKF